uniref:HMG box domain-containing protein n=1 Tax=Panagrolaimus sp. PS1159 TaxID=55785 RepID=A0AC35FH05_9BILA
MSECSSESELSNDSYSDKETPKLYEIKSDDRYSDVILVISDSVEFKKFQAEIVKAALEFLYGKSDAIKGKEMEVFKFAEEYDIEELKPGMGLADCVKAAGNKWQSLTDKSKWEKMAERDKTRYDEEYKFYQSHKYLITDE